MVFSLVSLAGVEPACPSRAPGFEPGVSTIPPQRHIAGRRRLELRQGGFGRRAVGRAARAANADSAETAVGRASAAIGHSVAQPRNGNGSCEGDTQSKRLILRAIRLGTGLAADTAVRIRQVERRVIGTAFRSLLHRRFGSSSSLLGLSGHESVGRASATIGGSLPLRPPRVHGVGETTILRDHVGDADTQTV